MSQEVTNHKAQGGAHKEAVATTNSFFSTFEQKGSDKSSPAPAGEKRLRVLGRQQMRSAAYDCVIPKITFDKAHPGLSEPCDWFLRWQRGKITDDKAQQCEQYWRGEYKTWDKHRLEENIKDLEEQCTDYVRRFPEEDAQHFKYEIELKRQELRWRQLQSDPD